MLARTVVSGTRVVAIRYGGAAPWTRCSRRAELDAVVDRCGAARLPIECAHIDLGRGRAKAMWGGPDYSP